MGEHRRIYLLSWLIRQGHRPRYRPAVAAAIVVTTPSTMTAPREFGI